MASRRPDAAGRARPCPRPARSTSARAACAPRRPRWSTGRARSRPAEPAGQLLERPLGGRQPDALGRPVGELLEPLQRQGQVGAPLGAGHGVDLVDDHVLDRRRASTRAWDVSSRYSDSGVVIRMSGGWRGQAAALLRRGVPGAGRHPDRRARSTPEPAGLAGDAGQRGPQVALDVVGQRLERARRRGPGSAGRDRRAPARSRSRSRAHRKAARVLPDPVGARIRVCSPRPMASQPSALGRASGPAKAAVEPGPGRRGENRSSTPSGYGVGRRHSIASARHCPAPAVASPVIGGRHPSRALGPDMEIVRWERHVQLRRPVLVAAFEGWNDAGDAATLAVGYLAEAWSARRFATHRPRGVLRLHRHPAPGPHGRRWRDPPDRLARHRAVGGRRARARTGTWCCSAASSPSSVADLLRRDRRGGPQRAASSWR